MLTKLKDNITQSCGSYTRFCRHTAQKLRSKASILTEVLADLLDLNLLAEVGEIWFAGGKVFTCKELEKLPLSWFRFLFSQIVRDLD